MAGMFRIVSGVVIGVAGFYQLGAYPVRGVCALFLAGFWIIIGVEEQISVHSSRTGE